MLFDKQVARKPNHYPWTKDFIQAMWDGFCNARKFTFQSDVNDYLVNMSEHERVIVTRCLAAIAQIEVQVKRFWARLGDNLPHPSIDSMGIVMAHVEEIHNDAYEKLLDCLGMSDIFEENLAVPAISNRIKYLNKHNEKIYGDNRKQYIYSLILFTLFTENVSLFTQFYIILWFNRFQNLLKDSAQQVKYTRNEELLHSQIGMKLINTLREEYPHYFDDDLKAKIIEECYEAYNAESNIVDWILGDYNMPNLNKVILKNYVASRINESLTGIGYEAIFKTDSELDTQTFWMAEGLYAPPKVDFFHGEPITYTQSDTTDDDDF